MPLGFRSTSHGVVAFGFFHIETNMLLLQRLFFWAADFCSMVEGLTEASEDAAFSAVLPGFTITEPQNVGDLHGAIAGRALHGFIGSLYRLSPFPARPEHFRQKPFGELAFEVVHGEMARFGRAVDIPVSAEPLGGEFNIGDYCFSRAGLQALVDYVWRGGMPGWLDGKRPPYVDSMAEAIAQRPGPWLDGLRLDPSQVGVPV